MEFHRDFCVKHYAGDVMWVFSEVVVSICYFEMIFCISWPFLWPVYKGQLHWTLIFLTCRYSVVGFLDKNKDNLYQDFKRLLYNRYGCPIDDFSIYLPAWQFIDIMRRNKLGTDRVVSFISLCSSHKILKEMWPEGKVDITKVFQFSCNAYLYMILLLWQK